MRPPADPRPARPRVGRLIAAQAAVAVLACVAAYTIGDSDAALAAAAGGGAALLPQAWFAWRVLRRDVIEGGAARMLRAMYLGEAVKLVAVGAAFVAIFRWWPQVPPLPLLLSFIAVQAVHWFAPLLLET